MAVDFNVGDREQAQVALRQLRDTLGWPALIALGVILAEEVEAEEQGMQIRSRGRRRLAAAAERLREAVLHVSQVLDDEDLW